VAFLCLASAEPAFACSCVPGAPISSEEFQKWLDAFDGAIFTGRAITSDVEQGVGTKVALAILSTLKPAELAALIDAASSEQ